MAEKETAIAEERMPFTQHLEELRRRVIIIFITVGIGFGLCYNWASVIVAFLKRPYPKQLIALAPTETFFVYLKVSFFVGVVLAVPVIIHQTWKFVAPGLLAHEKRYTLPFVILATIDFLIGAAFCYSFILPYGLTFLERYGKGLVTTQYSVAQYVSFCTKLIMAFGVAFEMPLVIFFLSKLGFVTPEYLAKNRRYAIVIIFIVAAILTPPDVFTQLALGTPLLLLYEISIIASRIAVRGSRTKDERS